MDSKKIKNLWLPTEHSNAIQNLQILLAIGEALPTTNSSSDPADWNHNICPKILRAAHKVHIIPQFVFLPHIWGPLSC